MVEGNIYIITATKGGRITFKFDVNGVLIAYTYEGDLMNDKQRNWLFVKMFPFQEASLKKWHAIKEFNISKGEFDLSFENFWNSYKKKAKKLVCQALWKKLGDDEKYNAIIFIRRYDNWLRLNNTAKALPDTYLRQKRWLDEL